MKQVELYQRAKIVVEQCAQVKPDEEVLVVTDTLEPLSIGEALMAAARAVGADGMLMVYPARERSPQEPPRTVAAAMRVANVVFAYTSSSLSHTAARVEAQRSGARIMTMPRLTEEGFLRTMLADLPSVATLTNKVAERIARAKRAHLTTEAGTDFTMELGNQPIIVDGYCRHPGEFDLIPFGVTVNVPKEGSSQGIIVVDGAITMIGKLSQTVTLKIENGRCVKIEGGEEADRLIKLLKDLKDENVYNCPAEWGVGTNPKAQLTGEDPSMEGERIYGWAHVSLGNNAAFPGGTVKAKVHLDCIFRNPVVKLDHEVILKDREFFV